MSPAHPPQADRIKATDYHPALRHQHTLDLAQGSVRVGSEFQRVRQYNQIQTAFRKRQCTGIRQKGNFAGTRRRPGCPNAVLSDRLRLFDVLRKHRCGRRQIFQRQPFVRHAVYQQSIELGHTKLQCVIAKDIADGLVKLCTLPIEQVSSGRRL